MGVVVDDGWGHAGLKVSSTVLVVKADEALMFRKGILYIGARPLIVVLNGLDPERCIFVLSTDQSPLWRTSSVNRWLDVMTRSNSSFVKLMSYLRLRKLYTLP